MTRSIGLLAALFLAIISMIIDVSGGDSALLQIVALVVLCIAAAAAAESGWIVLSIASVMVCAAVFGIGHLMSALGGNGSAFILFGGLILIFAVVSLLLPDTDRKDR